eukprot:4840977-Ditylum_brightwellii.AAC.1
MERSKQNEHLDCNEGNDVDNGVDNGDNDGVDNSADKNADKHLAHLSQAADCCMTERREGNKHLVCDEDNGVDNGVYNCDNDGVDNGDDDGVDKSADNSADKHLAHLSQAADCCIMERSKGNKYLVCDQDNDVDNGVDNGDSDSVDNSDDNSFDNGDNDGVDNGVDGPDKYLAYLSQAADCYMMERSKQNKYLVCDEDDGVDN